MVETERLIYTNGRGESIEINSGWDWLTGKVKEVADGLLDAAKPALGIESPSKKFRDIEISPRSLI